MGRLESLVAVVLVVVVSGVAWTWPRSATTSEPPVLVEAGAVGAPVTVHVSGAVARPGVVVLDGAARVVDAIAAVGGVTALADLDGVNLAAPLVDGTQVFVPEVGSDPARPAGDGRVAINTATADDLESLPGVGPVMAQRIIDHREDVGGFATPEDLLDVAGIGEATLARLRDLIRIP